MRTHACVRVGVSRGVGVCEGVFMCMCACIYEPQFRDHISVLFQSCYLSSWERPISQKSLIS